MRLPKAALDMGGERRIFAGFLQDVLRAKKAENGGLISEIGPSKVTPVPAVVAVPLPTPAH